MKPVFGKILDADNRCTQAKGKNIKKAKEKKIKKQLCTMITFVATIRCFVAFKGRKLLPAISSQNIILACIPLRKTIYKLES